MEPLDDETATEREGGDIPQRGPPVGFIVEKRNVRAEKGGQKTFGGWMHGR
jgi:hypothetical protein